MELRPVETFGAVVLSIQASSFHYCTPREDGFELDDYLSVEVGVRGLDGHLTLPSTVGAWGFDHLFEVETEYPVAPYMPQEVLKCLRAALAHAQEVA